MFYVMCSNSGECLINLEKYTLIHYNILITVYTTFSSYLLVSIPFQVQKNLQAQVFLDPERMYT